MWLRSFTGERLFRAAMFSISTAIEKAMENMFRFL
jgi:hypothetical protein